MPSITVDFDDLDNVTADVILAPGSHLEIVPEGLKIEDGFGGVGVTSPNLTEIYTYSSPDDNQGLFYRLGTFFGIAPWINPYPSQVTFIKSSSLVGNLTDFTDRVGNYNTTDNGTAPGPTAEWVGVDIGSGRSLILSDYLLRNGALDGLNAPSNWKCRGSNNVLYPYNVAAYNAADWTDIDTRVNNTDIAQTVDAWGHFSGFAVPAGYRFFQFLATGFNRTGSLYFIQIGEIEFYGTLNYGATFYDGSLCGFIDGDTVKPLDDDATTPSDTVTPVGYIKISIRGVPSWLPYYQ